MFFLTYDVSSFGRNSGDTNSESAIDLSNANSARGHRGTKVNESYHGDKTLVRPTGIQIATNPLPGPTNREHRKLIGVKTMSLCLWLRTTVSTLCPSTKVIKSDKIAFLLLVVGGLHEDKLYGALQAMTPINIKTVHQTSLLHIESSLDRLGLLSPTHGQRRSQQQNGHITLQSVLINKPKFLMATRHAEIRKIEIPRSMVVEVLSW